MDSSLYTVVPSKVLFDKSLQPAEILLYAMVCSNLDKRGACSSTDEEFASVRAWSIRQVKALVSSLENRGMIQVIKPKTKSEKRQIVPLV